MARQMVGDGDDVYRLKVTLSRPNWRGENTEFYGPFNSIGAARGQRTVHEKAVDYVVLVQVQRAHTEWSDVQ
ncbi:hypothetical protein [Streptomyces scopuliridis]|uniref:Uncharacterized protein n=1 Tax=Streptomyces scopuliridis TaxID=452529 RepID=A0ACD4ZS33_9ACTN|nr:hypothetical protein [Streptomyces scopuliridis]WSC01250.1 hypothetical protein OG835_32465 [Streptomyces scopuliridis]